MSAGGRSRRLGRLLAALCLAAACGSPEEPPPPLPPLPELALPEIEPPSHVPLPDAPIPEALRWDLSAGRLHSYRLRQETSSTMTAAFRDQVEHRRAEMTEEGFADFRGLGNGAGRLEFKLALREYRVDGAPQNVNDMAPAVFTAQVRSDGSFSGAAVLKGAIDPAVLDTIFWLPSAPGAPGARAIDRPEMEGRPAQKGTARTVAAGWAKIERYECLRLETDVDLELLQADGRGRLRSRIVAYFAPAEGRFVHIDAATVLCMRTRAKAVHPGRPAVWSIGSLDASGHFSAHIGS